MSVILIHGLHKSVIRIGRLAGQYAKPRSQEMETRGDTSLLNYRGDLINRPEFTAQARTPNPQLMLDAYHYSAVTLNHVRSLIDGGFTDLQHPEHWNLEFVKHSPMSNEYQKIERTIMSSLEFIKSIHGVQSKALSRIDHFFTSHEALHLPYEQALTRQIKNRSWYNLATHFPWIGMRTADPTGAHVEYMRGIKNPIGIKIGPQITSEWVKELINILNPDNEPGRLVLIHRFGVKQIEKLLPQLISTVREMKKNVVWCCDPMHGNTNATKDGIKTRRFEDILSELKKAFQIHCDQKTELAGVHFEMTGDNVTECTGGARGLTEEDLKNSYRSLCDPRLNYEQSLEMAMSITKHAVV